MDAAEHTAISLLLSVHKIIPQVKLSRLESPYEPYPIEPLDLLCPM